MAYQTFDTDLIKHLKRLANQGDEEAVSILRTEARRVVKAANSRLLRLERSGYSNVSNAYDIAQAHLEQTDRKRYKINNAMSIDDVAEELQFAKRFLSSETSTVRGVKYSKARLFETLDAYGINLGNRQDDFFRVLKSDAVQDFIDYVGEYEIAMEIISVQLGKMRKSVNSLIRDFENYLVKRPNYDEFIIKMGVDEDAARQRHREWINRKRTKPRRRS